MWQSHRRSQGVRFVYPTLGVLSAGALLLGPSSCIDFGASDAPRPGSNAGTAGVGGTAGSAGRASGGSATGGNPGGGTTQTGGSAGNPSGGNPECMEQSSMICDGTAVLERDPCTMTQNTIETCVAECYQGACVECRPNNGVTCDGDAVRSVDSCGEIGDVLETCESRCMNGQCVDASCTARASFQCVADFVYSVDSCGNLENVEAVCEDGCSGGRCDGCAPGASETCYAGSIYLVDSCGSIGALSLACDNGCFETIQDSGDVPHCIEDGLTCTPDAGTECALGDIHYVDSCGNIQTDVAEACPNGCDAAGCSPCLPVAVGTECVDDAVHVSLGGCDAPTVAGDELEDCEFGCDAGACLTSECRPNAGRTCADGDVHSLDSCGVIGPIVEACGEVCADGVCEGSGTGGAGSGGTSSGGTSSGGAPVTGGSTGSGGGGTSSSGAGGEPGAGGEVGSSGAGGDASEGGAGGDPPSCQCEFGQASLIACAAGDLRCGGCFGAVDDGCDSEELCPAACLPLFSCMFTDGINVLVYNGEYVMVCSSDAPSMLCELLDCPGPAGGQTPDGPPFE